MYLALHAARTEALKAAALHSLTGKTEDVDMFKLVMEAVKPAANKRHAMAHGLWGHSDELPDALLWISPEDHVSHAEAFRLYASKVMTDPNVERVPFLAPAIQVYRQGDLERDRDEVREASNRLYELRIVLSPTATPAAVAQIRSRLETWLMIRKSGARSGS